MKRRTARQGSSTKSASGLPHQGLSHLGLSHLDEAQRPKMVDVSTKVASQREATARATLTLPAVVARALKASGHRSKKGPVFETAIIAGVQAVKRTADLIPFCHPLPIEHVDIRIESQKENRIEIRCSVKTHHVTGVEMEALTGASVAALTIYDMCKALSHDIRIDRIQLLKKTGGKRDFER